MLFTLFRLRRREKQFFVKRLLLIFINGIWIEKYLLFFESEIPSCFLIIFPSVPIYFTFFFISFIRFSFSHGHHTSQKRKKKKQPMNQMNSNIHLATSEVNWKWIFHIFVSLKSYTHQIPMAMVLLKRLTWILNRSYIYEHSMDVYVL